MSKFSGVADTLVIPLARRIDASSADSYGIDGIVNKFIKKNNQCNIVNLGCRQCLEELSHPLEKKAGIYTRIAMKVVDSKKDQLLFTLELIEWIGYNNKKY